MGAFRQIATRPEMDKGIIREREAVCSHPTGRGHWLYKRHE